MRGTCGIFGRLLFGFEVHGAHRVPDSGPVLLLSNHQSHLDPVLVGVASPRQLRYLARDTLFVWPLGWLIRSLGAIPIDREAGLAGLRATMRILRDQQALLLFPEGTRSPDGRLQPLKPGFLAVARRSGGAVVPVGIAGAFAALPRGRKLPTLHKIVIHFGEPLPAQQLMDLSDDQLLELVGGQIRAAAKAAQAFLPAAPQAHN